MATQNEALEAKGAALTKLLDLGAVALGARPRKVRDGWAVEVEVLNAKLIDEPMFVDNVQIIIKDRKVTPRSVRRGLRLGHAPS